MLEYIAQRSSGSLLNRSIEDLAWQGAWFNALLLKGSQVSPEILSQPKISCNSNHALNCLSCWDMLQHSAQWSFLQLEASFAEELVLFYFHFIVSCLLISGFTLISLSLPLITALPFNYSITLLFMQVSFKRFLKKVYRFPPPRLFSSVFSTLFGWCISLSPKAAGACRSS